jgi:hypothetical protein
LTESSGIIGNVCVKSRDFPISSSVKRPESSGIIGTAFVKGRDFPVPRSVNGRNFSALSDFSGNWEGSTQSYWMKNFPFPGQFGLAASDDMNGKLRPTL